MKHFKNLVNESKHLTVFEMLSKLQTFLQEKYGIKSFGAKKDNHFIMHISTYVDEEKRTKDLSEEIKKFVVAETELENVEVVKDAKGYTITFGHDAQKAKLIEVTQAQGTGMSDAKVSYKCHFCDDEFEGYGNDPWPIGSTLEHRVCDNCNEEFVIPARIEMFKKQGLMTEATKDDVEHSASNAVLDNKFTWLFSVMDKNGRDISEGIEFIYDAIDVFIKNNAAFLVAFPYVDPKPEDPNVDFVFADNPGPVVIYNNETVTVPKKALEKPASEEQPKPDNEEETEEEVVEEAVIEEGIDDQIKKLKKQIDDLRDKNNEIRKGHMSGSVRQNTKRIEELEEQIRELRMQRIQSGQNEAADAKTLVYVFDVVIPGERLDDGGEFTFAVENLNGIKAQIEEEISRRYGFSPSDIESYDWQVEDDQIIEESLENENTEDLFSVTLDMLPSWYQAMEKYEVEPFELFESLVNTLEEYLQENNVFISFDYAGQANFDLQSSFTDFNEAMEAHDLLRDFLGTWANIRVRKQDF